MRAVELITLLEEKMPFQPKLRKIKVKTSTETYPPDYDMEDDTIDEDGENEFYKDIYELSIEIERDDISGGSSPYWFRSLDAEDKNDGSEVFHLQNPIISKEEYHYLKYLIDLDYRDLMKIKTDHYRKEGKKSDGKYLEIETPKTTKPKVEID